LGLFEVSSHLLLVTKDGVPLGVAVQLSFTFATATSALCAVPILGRHHTINTVGGTIIARELDDGTGLEDRVILTQSILFSSRVINRHVAKSAWPTREQQKTLENRKTALTGGGSANV
jgi:hypothetical protein